MRVAVLLGLVLLVPIAAAAPEQVHLGLPTDGPATALSVLWLDTDPQADPTVRLVGPEGERSFTGRRVDGPSAGFAFEARLDPLTPGATYEYSLGGRSFSFQAPAAEAAPFTLLALGDMGIGAEARKTVQRALDADPALVLHAGDVSYAEGDPVAWAEWFGLVEPAAATRPWVTALGNHETYTGSSLMGIAGVPSPAEVAFYKQRFGLPGNELWYSFDWQGAHIVALDTFSDRSIRAEEVSWLEEDLASHADAPWTIVFLHEPPWSSNEHGSSQRVQDAFVPLFEENGVDLVIAAHDHGYERTIPMNGVTYVVTGGGGESLYADWKTPAPEWSAARGAAYHALRLDVSPDAIVGTVLSENLTDSFRIDRAPRSGEVSGAVAGGAPVPALAPLGVVVALVAVALARRR